MAILLQECRGCENAADSVELPGSLLVFNCNDGPRVYAKPIQGRRQSFVQRSGSFDFFPDGTLIRPETSPAGAAYWIAAIPTEWVCEVMNTDSATVMMAARFQFHDQRLVNMLIGMQNHQESGDSLGALYCESLSIGIAERLFNGLEMKTKDTGQPGFSPPMKKRIEEFLREYLSAPPVISKIAALSGLRESEFMKSFKASFGVTPHQFVLQCRIEKAQLLLSDQHRTVASVAMELGFASHAHLTHAFRARTGMAPSTFRQMKL